MSACSRSTLAFKFTSFDWHVEEGVEDEEERSEKFRENSRVLGLAVARLVTLSAVQSGKSSAAAITRSRMCVPGAIAVTPDGTVPMEAVA